MISQEGSETVKKGPLSFLSGAISSIFFSWLCFSLSKKVIVYFALHSPQYSSQIAQSISSAIKTLAIGMCFLATFTFAFIGLGLTIVFIRSLFTVRSPRDD
uniref:DUF3082 domain-containing protein n=1 Tax=Prochlorococcus sp. SS52 TaxID=1499501 RepID=UPI001CED296B|nr:MULTISPECIES: DUF3082 domain-containing protein [Prochlorococcus]